jgi:IS5 family transposase
MKLSIAQLDDPAAATADAYQRLCVDLRGESGCRAGRWEGRMLRLTGGQVESLFDQLLPVEVRKLPADLAALDRLLADPRLLAPIEQAWAQTARRHGRPTIPMTSFVRLMVIKQRTGWGYQTLVREVSDSLHLRRFCLLPLTARVPEESTVRKLVRRLGPETVNELTRAVIGKAQRETRFAARAVRIDATVVEADIRYPTDTGLAWQGTQALAREGRKLAARLRGPTRRVVDRSRRIGRLVRAISRTLVRRTGQRRQDVMALNTKAGRVLARSVAEARVLAAQARATARGRGARAKLAAARRLRSWPTAASASPPRSSNGSVGRSSATGWCRWLTRTPARSARASSARQPVRLCRPARRGHRQHRSWRPRLSAAGGDRTGQPGREPPACPDRRRAGPPGASTTRGRAGRRLPARPDRPEPGWADTGTHVHRPAGRAGLSAHPPAAGPLPHRLRGPHQPPQAPLWAAPQPPAGRPGSADLDRLGDPGLQPGHPCRPHRLTGADRWQEPYTSPCPGRLTLRYPGQVTRS